MKFAYLILGEFVYPQDSAAIHGETAADHRRIQSSKKPAQRRKNSPPTAWAASSFAVRLEKTEPKKS